MKRTFNNTSAKCVDWTTKYLKEMNAEALAALDSDCFGTSDCHIQMGTEAELIRRGYVWDGDAWTLNS